MSNGFMAKETLIQEAQRLGVNIEGVPFPTANKIVKKALRKEAEQPIIIENEHPQAKAVQDMKRYQQEADEFLRGKKILIAPEMLPQVNQLLKYDEELDEDIEIAEIPASTDMLPPPDPTRPSETRSATYKRGKKKGRKVVAQSTAPKQNFRCTYEHAKDFVPVAEFMGRRGYLLTHQSLPNVKDCFEQAGVWEKYKHLFQTEPNVWHAAGKCLVCSIPLVHSLIEEIEAEAQRKLNG